MKAPPRKHVSGFSLMEILAVVTILVVLIALAYPLFGKIRQHTDMTRCASHLRTMGVAIFAYAADHGGLLPGPTVADQLSYYSARHVASAMQTGTTQRPLLAFLVPYMNLPVPTDPARENDSIFPAVAECPAAKREIIAAEGKITKDNVKYFHTPATRFKEGNKDVDFRPFGYSSSSATNPTMPSKLSALKEPASTVGIRDRIVGVHGGVTNMLLMDGSAVGLREDQFEIIDANGKPMRLKSLR